MGDSDIDRGSRRLIPVVCTLSGADVEARVAEWRAVLDRGGRREPVDGGVRIGFDPAAGVGAAELARLAEAEHDCCGFLGFAVTVDERGLGLEVRTSEDGRAVLDALFA